MGRIVVSVVLLILLTILIIWNVGYTVPINLFWVKFPAVPVVAIAMLSFVLGVVYSLFLYIGQYIHRNSRERLAKRHREVEERERKLAQGETPPPPESPASGHDDAQAGSERPRGSALSRFFGLFR